MIRANERRRFRFAAVMCVVAGSAACLSIWPTGNEPARCSGADLGLAARGALPAPTFEWNSGCPAWQLVVTYDSNNTWITAWSISGPDVETVRYANIIQSPVTYGTVPAGAHALVSPAPLIPGRQYRVTLYGKAALYEGHPLGEHIIFSR